MNARSAWQGLNGGLLAAALVAAAAQGLRPSDAFAQELAVGEALALRIAAGPVGEPMFGMAGVIANIVSNPPGGPACPAGQICGFPGLVGEARATAGSLANVESLATGLSETAIVEGDLLWQAHNGFGQFAGGPLGDLRALAVLYSETVMVIVRADSTIDGIAGLSGRVVAMGPLGNRHLPTIYQILAGHGVRERELTQIHLTTVAAANALAFGDIDAAIVVAPTLPSAFRAVAERTPLRALPVSSESIALLSVRHPYLIPVEIGDLAEGGARTAGLAIAVLWVATQRLPAPVAYGLVRSLRAPGNRETLAQVLPPSAAVAVQGDLSRSPIPLHAGAARYLEEASGVVR